MGILELFRNRKGAGKSTADLPIEIDSKGQPGTKLTLMSYNEALGCVNSGDAAKMTEAIGMNILSATAISLTHWDPPRRKV
jgi:hypothetical protein